MGRTIAKEFKRYLHGSRGFCLDPVLDFDAASAIPGRIGLFSG